MKTHSLSLLAMALVACDVAPPPPAMPSEVSACADPSVQYRVTFVEQGSDCGPLPPMFITRTDCTESVTVPGPDSELDIHWSGDAGSGVYSVADHWRPFNDGTGSGTFCASNYTATAVPDAGPAGPPPTCPRLLDSGACAWPDCAPGVVRGAGCPSAASIGGLRPSACADADGRPVGGCGYFANASDGTTEVIVCSLACPTTRG